MYSPSSEFKPRGQPGNDRDYRHPRQRTPRNAKDTNTASSSASAGRKTAPRPRPQLGPAKPADEWKRMPPLEDVIDAVDRFTKDYLQLGFLPKQQFRERLLTNHRSINVFLLLGILSISARMTPALIKEYGSGMDAAEHFMERASEHAGQLYLRPSLETCQGFYLLSLAQQGSGLRNDSYVSWEVAFAFPKHG